MNLFNMFKKVRKLKSTPKDQESDPRYQNIFERRILHLVKNAGSLSSNTEAINKNPKNKMALMNRGICYLYQKQYDQAINDFSLVLINDPQNAEAWINRGLCFEAKGEHEKAFEDYCQAITFDPRSDIALTLRGKNYLNIHQRINEAIDDFSHAIALNPRNYTALFFRGRIEQHRKEYLNAIKYYSEIIQINPGYIIAYLYRGDAYRALGDANQQKSFWEKAITDYSQALTLDPGRPDPDNYKRRGMVYFSLSDDGKGASDFTEAIKIDPTDGDAYFMRGMCKLKTDEAGADSDIKNAMALDSKLAGEMGFISK